MDRHSKQFKLNVLNQILIVLVMLMILYASYLFLSEIANGEERVFHYEVLECTVKPLKNNVSVAFNVQGNYTVLIEYVNTNKNNVPTEKYYEQYELTNITIGEEYVFDVSREYDDVYLIVRNNDLKFSEGYKIY